MKFEINKDELLILEKWLLTHKCVFSRDPLSAGAIGGRLSYKFTPTSIGMITVVTCLCGEETNITNFDDW